MNPMPEVPQHQSKATRREWIGLAVIALPCVLYSMDLTVLNLAVPRLSEDLKPTSAQLLWILDIYGFSDACVVRRVVSPPSTLTTYTPSNPSRPEMKARRLLSGDHENCPSYRGDVLSRVRWPPSGRITSIS